MLLKEKNIKHVVKRKEYITLNLEFWLVYTHVVKVWDHFNENLSSCQITIWYQFFWNTLYINIFFQVKINTYNGQTYCNIMAEGFRFIYLAFGFS